MVWTIRDGVGVHLLNTTDEREAREFLAEPARDPS
jgi:hypothetical protein